MKKALLIFSLLLTFTFIGCNKDEEEFIPSNNFGISSSEEETQEGFSFLYKDTEISVGTDMAPVLSALGEPTSYFESNSCAFQGLDKVYTYGSVIIRTYPQDGDDYILSVELKDDSIQTPEGVSIGNTLEFAESVYGKPDEKNGGSLVYKKGNSVLSFIAKNDEISAITYTQNSDQ